MSPRARWCVLALTLAGCAGRPPQPHPAAANPANPASAVSTEQLAAAVAADAARSDRESDAKVRERIADDAILNADTCVAKAPQAAECLYERAVALGLQARAHPARALDSLKTMLDLLSRADAADADYDEAGASRVRALVLIRAPGWPLGPGDVDAGLESARRAMSLKPQYVPNILALAEAQAKSADLPAAHDSYARARGLAQTLPPGQDRDDWLRQAEQGLQRK